MLNSQLFGGQRRCWGYKLRRACWDRDWKCLTNWMTLSCGNYVPHLASFQFPSGCVWWNRRLGDHSCRIPLESGKTPRRHFESLEYGLPQQCRASHQLAKRIIKFQMILCLKEEKDVKQWGWINGEKIFWINCSVASYSLVQKSSTKLVPVFHLSIQADCTSSRAATTHRQNQ